MSTTSPRHLVIASEQRLDRELASRVQSDVDALGRPYSRLSAHFQSTTIVSRASDMPDAIGPVRIRSLPDFRGIGGMLRQGWALFRAGRDVLHDADLVVIPVPSFATLPIWFAARAKGVPWIAHVVGDSGEVPRTLGMRGAGIWGRISAAVSRSQVNGAVGVWYVTREVLQGRYQAHPVSLVASNVSITDEWFAPPRARRADERCRIVFVGSLERPYKGLDVLLRALAAIGAAASWSLDVIGDGELRGDLTRQATSLKLDGSVTWHGQLSREEVRKVLQDAHVFVMPSLTEGLPRALVEAMASGLACVGTRVGGIPELLPAEALIEPGDTESLAAAISRLIVDEDYRKQLAQRCHEESRRYARGELEARIDEFAAEVVATLGRPR